LNLKEIYDSTKFDQNQMNEYEDEYDI